MTDERLQEIEWRLAEVRKEHSEYGRVTYTVRWDMSAMDELIAEVKRLKASRKRIRKP